MISLGIGWSATTPLWYTLQADNQYLHVGIAKDCEYLPLIAEKPADRLKKRLEHRKRFKAYGITSDYVVGRALLTGAFKFSNRKFYHNVSSRIPEEKCRIPEVKKDLFLTQEEIDDYTSLPLSLEKYINYYKRLWETLQENNCPYKAVGDFSNANAWMPEEFCHKLVERLSEYFDVKAVMIVRDPIRRLWSEASGRCGLRNYEDQPDGGTEEEQHKLFYDFIKRTNQSSYFRIIDKWEKICPLHVIIMEQLWEGDKQEREKQRLSDFLDYDIKNIHENVYCPDRGPNAPKYAGLMDQWSSDKYWLRDELYNQVKPFFPVYQQWVDRYGSLPLYWGKPYNYEV